MKKNVFISYNHSSEIKNSVRQISDRLKNMGLGVWLDEQQIKPGDSISDALDRGLNESSYVVAVVGPNDKESKWAKIDLQRAISKGKRVIPVMVNHATSNDLPDVVSNYMAVDVSENPDNLIKVYDSIDQERSGWSRLKEYIIND
jgi:hypothetical protein